MQTLILDNKCINSSKVTYNTSNVTCTLTTKNTLPILYFLKTLLECLS